MCVKNHHKKEYRVMRSVCLWLYDYKCFVCNKVESEMHVHHLNEISDENELENLIPLCSKHHRLLHKTSGIKKRSRMQIVSLLLRKINYYLKLRSW